MGLDEELWDILEDGVSDLDLDEEGAVVDRKKHTCHTLILDLKILVQISFLFLTLFQFTVYYSAIYHCASAAYVIISVF